MGRESSTDGRRDVQLQSILKRALWPAALSAAGLNVFLLWKGHSQTDLLLRLTIPTGLAWLPSILIAKMTPSLSAWFTMCVASLLVGVGVGAMIHYADDGQAGLQVMNLPVLMLMLVPIGTLVEALVGRVRQHNDRGVS